MNLRSRAALPAESAAGISLGERIYRRVRWSLIVGDLEPGARLSTRGLAGRHGTSQMPVREALKRLAAEAAIEGADRRAYRVPGLEPGRAADLFEVRAVLEGAAAYAASGRLTDADIRRLARLARGMDRAMRRESARRYLAANFAFHSTINAAAGNREMLAIVQSLYARTGPWLAHAIRNCASVEDWKNRHSDIVDSIAARDAARTRDLVTADICWNVEVFRGRSRSDGAPRADDGRPDRGQ